MGVLVFSLAAVAALVEGLLRRGRSRLVLGGLALLSLGVAVLFLAAGGFEARKVAGRLVMPAGLVWVALLALVVFDLHARRWRRAALSAGVFLLHGAAGSVLLGHVLVRSLESEIPLPPRDGPPFDAVFVLGGGTALGPRGEPQLGAAGDRLRLAAELWQEGRAETLVASGFSPPPFGLGDLAATTRSLWSDWGVPERAVTVLSEPTDTRSEIRAYAELARARGWDRMGLVSSAWHLPRALACARDVGLEVTPLPADHRASRPPELSALWLVPQRRGFALTELWAWERLGRLLER